MANRRVLKESWQVAALIAEMMKRAKQTRARLSDRTLKLLAGRVKLENSVREQIRSDALSYGYLLHKLEAGGPTSGTVVLDLNSLHAAKPLKYKDSFKEDERGKIREGNSDFFVALHESLLGGDDDDDAGDE